jgi:hypothetical protein
MLLIQEMPEGLKASEVERGNDRFQPPILYIPESIKTVDPDRKVPTVKVELKNGVESRIQVYEGDGTKEHCMCSILNVREALGGMGLFNKYKEARKSISNAKEALQNEKDLHEMVLKQIENIVLEAYKVPLREEVAKHNKAIKKHKAAVAAAKQEITAGMATIFSTTANFFRGEGKLSSPSPIVHLFYPRHM